MRILIIKSSSLGDVVHALPAVRAFKAARPEAEIDWVVEAFLAPVLEGHPDLNRLVRLDSHTLRRWPLAGKTLADQGRFLAELRKTRYDAIVDLQRLLKSALVVGLARGERRFGFAWSSCREPLSSLVLSRRARINYRTDPIRTQYLAVLELVAGRALAFLPPPDLVPDEAVTAELAGKLGPVFDQLWDRPWAAALLGGGFETKLWPLAHWAEVLQLLGREMAVILPWQGPKEERRAREAARTRPGLIVPPALNLKELMALLGRARLVVGGDTGPLHLAAALGRPTVSFYGPTLAARNAPPGHLFVQSPVACAGCVKRTCPKEKPDCLTSIAPQRVWALVKKALAG